MDGRWSSLPSKRSVISAFIFKDFLLSSCGKTDSPVLLNPSQVHGIGCCCRTTHEGFQFAGVCEHSMGLCHSGPQGGIAAHGIGSYFRGRMKDFHTQNLSNTAWASATVGHKEKRWWATWVQGALAEMPKTLSLGPCAAKMHACNTQVNT